MEKENKKEKKTSVHEILAQSYLLTFSFFLLGVILDFIFKFKYFENPIFVYVGILIMFLGSILIYLAQKTSRKLNINDITKETFMKGPYKFSRTPTHWGMLFLVTGFGIASNALFIVLTAILAFLFSKTFFLKKEEKILLGKYGAPYLEYKKVVRL
ncbi:MAG: methyltransferase [bacterium]